MAWRREVEINNGNHRGLPHSPVDRPLLSFFKIILPSIIQEKKMRIPDKFVRKFGDELSEVVTFIIPNGLDWKVGLTRAESDIWFDDGWHDFVQHNSICTGYFLVFGYKGFSNFSILIFDKTACEIKYPDKGSVCGQNCLIPYENGVDKNNSAIPSPFTSYSLKSKLFVETPTRGDSSKRRAGARNSGIKKQCGGVGSMVNPNVNTKRKRIEKEEAVEITNIDTNESKREKFHKQRMSSSKVQLDNNKSPHKCEEDTEIITSEKFECVKVSPKSEKAIRAARMLQPKNPSFMVVLRSSSLMKNIVCVPIRFARRYLSRGLEFIKIQDSDGRDWSVNLCWDSHRVNLGRGWNVLCREKKLKRGDVCLFELIKNDMLKISIFCANQSVENYKEDLEIITSEMFGCAKPSPESQRAIEAARMLKPKNPSFMVLLRPYNCRNSILYVPSKFAKRYLSRGPKNIKLQVSDGKEWAVCLLQQGYGRSLLGKGWKIFCRENTLEGGDVCLFELINNYVLKVFIFHAVEISNPKIMAS
ncbi:B3 domain-containing transcription factor VRN1-like [Jatropha curcas]|uniref:B3 domain-containing transcription factor VRN1-like n=1 Tax=Jatropha curcas TaxID=180498 RepID=UPI0009D668EA|nr:B3 domain-containing transcription factor VRN1-like [Jatropha curcas]